MQQLAFGDDRRNLPDRQDHDFVAPAHRDALEIGAARGRVERRGGGRHRIARSAGRPAPATAPGRAWREALAFDRLQQIVDRVQLERLHRESSNAVTNAMRRRSACLDTSRATSRPPSSGICRSSSARSGRCCFDQVDWPPCRSTPRPPLDVGQTPPAARSGTAGPAARRRRSTTRSRPSATGVPLTVRHRALAPPRPPAPAARRPCVPPVEASDSEAASP